MFGVVKKVETTLTGATAPTTLDMNSLTVIFWKKVLILIGNNNIDNYKT